MRDYVLLPHQGCSSFCELTPWGWVLQRITALTVTQEAHLTRHVRPYSAHPTVSWLQLARLVLKRPLARQARSVRMMECVSIEYTSCVLRRPFQLWRKRYINRQHQRIVAKKPLGRHWMTNTELRYPLKVLNLKRTGLGTQDCQKSILTSLDYNLGSSERTSPSQSQAEIGWEPETSGIWPDKETRMPG